MRESVGHQKLSLVGTLYVLQTRIALARAHTEAEHLFDLLDQIDAGGVGELPLRISFLLVKMSAPERKPHMAGPPSRQ